MSKPRYRWCGYVRNVIRAYPALKERHDELHSPTITAAYSEAARKFEVGDGKRVASWERIYLEEGADGLHIERRGRRSTAGCTQKGHRPKLDKQVEEDLSTEVQLLRAEVAYLKNLHALVSERVRRENGYK